MSNSNQSSSKFNSGNPQATEASTSRAISLEKAVRKILKVGGQEFGLWMVDDMDSLIDDFVAEQSEKAELKDRCPFGAVLWPSGRAFAEWMLEQQAQGLFPPFPTAHALELGCGVGLVSCMLARCGFKTVLATDYEPAFAAFVECNSSEFGVQGKIQFQTLDWTLPLPTQMRAAFPVIVACDVLYDNSHIASLPAIARDLLTTDGVFYLADPERFRFASAKQELARCFAEVRAHVLEIDNSTADENLGLVKAGHKVTKVHILECRKPRR